MPAAAKNGDSVKAIDVHEVYVGDSTQMLRHPFRGQLIEGLSSNVLIQDQPAATLGSIAKNVHVARGNGFVKTPENNGSITSGSSSVFINGKAAARNGDTVETCDDIKQENSNGKVIASGSVLIGD